MIEVKNNRIYFYNMNKRDIIPVDFQCVSAYLCPHCKKVLAAYYAGKIVDLEPFCEDPSDKHHYTLGTSNGGQYLLLEDHNHKKGYPGREIVSLSVRGITYSILVLYNEHMFINMNKPGFGESMKRTSNLSDYVAWVVAGDYSKSFEPSVKPEIVKPVDAPKDALPLSIEVKAEEQRQEQSIESVFGEVISSYSRAEALADGVLIDVTETAKEAGIVYPVAISQGLWGGYIEVPESLKGIQDLQGRLWGVLTMFRFSARATKKADDDVVGSQRDAPQTMFFKTIFQMPSTRGTPKMETVSIKSICGPGDNAEPVLTFMLPEES